MLQLLLAPPICESCEGPVDPGELLCGSCEQSLKPNNQHFCSHCALPFEGGGAHLCENCIRQIPSYQRAWASLVYRGALPQLLGRAKYSRNLGVLDWLARRSLPQFQEALQSFEPDGMVPMPLSWRRQFRRGFNQSAVLLNHWRRLSHSRCPMILGGISRRHATPQAELNRDQRLKQMKGLFEIRRAKSFIRKKILIVDDVMTTGATVEALSQSLLVAGAQKVGVMALARVPKIHGDKK